MLPRHGYTITALLNVRTVDKLMTEVVNEEKK